jgi:hypothetical protein
MTPPKTHIDGQTKMFIQTNDGSKQYIESGIKETHISNSCQDFLQGRTAKIMFRIKDNMLNIFNDGKDYIYNNCLTHFKNTITPPYRVGVSSLNGIIDGENYLDNVEIEKFTIFNLDSHLKANYTDRVIDNKDDKNDLPAPADLVEYYQTFKKNILHFTDLNSKLDDSILKLSDITKSIENVNISFNTPAIKNIENLIISYKSAISKMQEKIQELHMKLLRLTTDKVDFSQIFTDLNFNILLEEVNLMKAEWNRNKIKNSLNNQLNEMLTKKIDELVESIKTTHEMHNKYAISLVSKYNYMTLKLIARITRKEFR